MGKSAIHLDSVELGLKRSQGINGEATVEGRETTGETAGEPAMRAAAGGELAMRAAGSGELFEGSVTGDGTRRSAAGDEIGTSAAGSETGKSTAGYETDKFAAGGETGKFAVGSEIDESAARAGPWRTAAGDTAQRSSPTPMQRHGGKGLSSPTHTRDTEEKVVIQDTQGEERKKRDVVPNTY